MKSFFATFFFAICLSSSAFAFGSIGARVGSGFSFEDAKDMDTTPFAAGLAYKLNLLVLDVEVDALYWRNSGEWGIKADDYDNHDFVQHQLAFPVMGKFTLPVIPLMLDVTAGLGLEPRINLMTKFKGEDVNDAYNRTVMYLPIVLGANLSLAVINLNVEMRYERQLTDFADDMSDKIHQLMFFGGVFF